jgi:hypothetical protein
MFQKTSRNLKKNKPEFEKTSRNLKKKASRNLKTNKPNRDEERAAVRAVCGWQRSGFTRPQFGMGGAGEPGTWGDFFKK